MRLSGEVVWQLQWWSENRSLLTLEADKQASGRPHISSSPHQGLHCDLDQRPDKNSLVWRLRRDQETGEENKTWLERSGD